MTQLVTRVDRELVEAVDQLVAEGVVASRSEAVRMALYQLVDRHRRAEIGRAIVAGYQAVPQDDDESEWPDTATVAMIADEPW